MGVCLTNDGDGSHTANLGRRGLTEDELRVKREMEQELGRKINVKNVPRIAVLKKKFEALVASKDVYAAISDEGAKIIAEISFLGFDRNGDGYLDKREFKACMEYSGTKSGRKFTDAEIEKDYKRLDVNQDNKISLVEYANMVQQGMAMMRQMN